MMLQLVSCNRTLAYDPLIPDAYLKRVGMASEACGIFAKDDIFNVNNVLLVAKGTQFTSQVITAILNNRLRHPIEESIQLARSVNEHELRKHLFAVIEQDDFLSSLNEHQDLHTLITPFIMQYSNYPLLMQKLSVMAIAMPESYTRSLYCTWLAVVIAKEMHFSESGCLDVFLAALCHDIGMLHVEPFILEKKGELTPDDWRHIQGHVAVGKRLLESMPSMPKEVVDAVFEHHERCDGTGYPSGKVESELGYAGKLVGLADSIVAIYHNRFKAQKRSWREVIPVIQMNAQAYFYRHDEILAVIWLRSEMPFKNVVAGDELPAFIEDLLQKNERLKLLLQVLRDKLLSIGFRHGDRQLHSLQNIALHLATSLKGSGIFEDSMVEWLRTVDIETDKEAYQKIEKAHTQHQEIVFHLQRLNRMIQLYLDSDHFKNHAIKAALTDAMEKSKELIS